MISRSRVTPRWMWISWKRIIQICKDYGLNGMRFHSWRPPEAAFEAADELGFYLQPECGMWNNFSTPGMTQRLYDESARILKAYGNHPSFVMFSPSNEPSGSYGIPLPQNGRRRSIRVTRAASIPLARLECDPAGHRWRARCLHAQLWPGFPCAAPPAGSARTTARRSPMSIFPCSRTKSAKYCAYPDFDVIKEFTGYSKPSNYDIFKYIAMDVAIEPMKSSLSSASITAWSLRRSRQARLAAESSSQRRGAGSDANRLRRHPCRGPFRDHRATAGRERRDNCAGLAAAIGLPL